VGFPKIACFFPFRHLVSTNAYLATPFMPRALPCGSSSLAACRFVGLVCGSVIMTMRKGIKNKPHSFLSGVPLDHSVVKAHLSCVSRPCILPLVLAARSANFAV
jgi:hypothetical protein